MSFFRLPSLRNLISKSDNRGRRSRRRAGQKGQRRKPHLLRLDPLEDRVLLSVVPADLNDMQANQTYGDPTTSAKPSIAADHQGDFVIAWQQDDPVYLKDATTGQLKLQPDPNNPGQTIPIQRTDPTTGQPMVHTNVYARYLTDPVQRITLPADVVPGSGMPVGRFKLTYGGPELQEITVDAGSQPGQYPFAVSTGVNITGTFRIWFDANGNGQIDPGEEPLVTFDESQPELNAQRLQQALAAVPPGYGTGGQVIGDSSHVKVTAISPQQYMVDFGEQTAQVDQPQIKVVYDLPNNAPNLTGFLPAVTVTTVRQPTTIDLLDPATPGSHMGIPISSNPADTAQAIEDAFAGANVQTHLTAPTQIAPVSGNPFGNGGPGIGPYSSPDSQTLSAAQVSVVPVSLPGVADGRVFDVTFTGPSGKQDQPLLVVTGLTRPTGEQEPTPANTVVALKGPSDAFRVNPDETDELYNGTSSMPARVDSTHPEVAMNADGEFVITWMTNVPGTVNQGGTTRDTRDADIYARRFSPTGYFSPSANASYQDPLLDTQGVRLEVAPRVDLLTLSLTDPTWPTNARVTGTFTLTIGGKTTEPIPFDSDNLAMVAQGIQTGLLALDPIYEGTTVTSVKTVAPYQFQISFGNRRAEHVSDIMTAAYTPDSGMPAMLAADQKDITAADPLWVLNTSPGGYTFRVNTTTTNRQYDPAVGMDPNGNFLIAWANNGQDLSYFNGISAQMFDRFGEPVASQFAVSPERTSITWEPFVATGTDGRFLVTWTTTDDPSYLQGRAYFSNITGTLFLPMPSGQTFDPNTVQKVTVFGPRAGGSAAAFDSQNRFIIMGDGLGDPDPILSGSMGVSAIWFSADGSVLVPTFRVNSASLGNATTWWPLRQEWGMPGLDANGDLIMSYQGYGPDTSVSVSTDTAASNYLQSELSKPENADLLAYFPYNYLPIYTLNFDYPKDSDSVLDEALWTASKNMDSAGLTTQDRDLRLGRLRVILDNVLNLLRGQGDAVMYTRIDADPRFGAPPGSNVLYTDSVVNTQRNGSNQHYYISFARGTTGGNIQLELWIDGYATRFVTGTIDFANNNGVPNLGQIEQNIDNALEGLFSSTGAWPQAANNSGYDGPVHVRYVDPTEITDRSGTYWDLQTFGFNPGALDYTFEITFQGALHDVPITMDLAPNSNKLTAVATAEVQDLLFQPTATAGWFRLQMQMPNGALQTTADIYFDPTDMAATAGRIQAALVGAGFAGLTVFYTGTPYQFQITFGGNSAGTDWNQLAVLLPTVQVPPLPGVVPPPFTNTVADGHGNTPQAPQFLDYTPGTTPVTTANPSIAVTPDGDYILAWTGYSQFSDGLTANSNVYYRRFTETADTTGPQITGMVDTDGSLIDNGDTVQLGTNRIILTFDEQLMSGNPNQVLDSVLNPQNYELQLNGVAIPGAIVGVDYGMNRVADLAAVDGLNPTPNNKWEVILTLDSDPTMPGNQPLTAGAYTIVAKAPTATTSGLRDANGNPLGKNGYQPNGVNGQWTFVVPTAATASGSKDQSISVDPAPGITYPGRTFPESPGAVAVDPEGNHVVVWTSQVPLSGNPTITRDRVYFGVYSPDGTPASGVPNPVPVTADGDFPLMLMDSQRNAEVATDADGDFVITWTNYNDNDANIWARRYHANGTPDGDPFQVNDFDAHQDAVQQLSLTRGQPVSFYLQFNGVPTSQITLSANDFSNDVTLAVVRTTLENALNATVGSPPGQPAFAVSPYVTDPNDSTKIDFDITFVGANGSSKQLPLQMSVDGGLNWTPLTTVADGKVSNQKWSSVAMDAAGDFVITWSSYGQEDNGAAGEGYGVYARRYSAAGLPLEPEFPVNVTTTGDQERPSISMDAQGDFVIAWTSTGQGGNNIGSNIVVRAFQTIGEPVPFSDAAQYYNGTGGPHGGEMVATGLTTGGTADYPDVAMDLSGQNFVVTWSSDGNGGVDYGVAARTYGFNAAQGDYNPTTNGFRVNTTRVWQQMFSTVAISHQDQFVVAWSGYGDQPGQEDKSGFGVFFQRFQLDGTPLQPNGTPTTDTPVPLVHETRANVTTQGNQYFPSIGMDGKGDFVLAWTGDAAAGTSVFRYISQNVLPMTDLDGPLVGGVDSFLSNGTIQPLARGDVIGGTSTQPSITRLLVSFSEPLSVQNNTTGLGSVTNPANWTLARNGTPIMGGVQSITPLASSATYLHRHEYIVTFDGNGLGTGAPALLAGDYTLTISNTITDNSNNALDGDFDGAPGMALGSSSTPGYQIHFGVALGNQLGPEVRVNQTTAGDQRFTQNGGTGLALEKSNRTVAVDNKGDFVVVWTSYGQDGDKPTDGNIYYRVYNSSDQPLTPELRANVNTAGNQHNASVAVDADGDFVIAWESDNGDPQSPSSTDIYARRFNSMGVPQVSDSNGAFTTHINSADGTQVQVPMGDGLVVTATTYPDLWNYPGPNSDYPLRDNNSEFLVNTTTYGAQTAPAVAVNSEGDFVVVWATSARTFGNFNDVYAQVYTDRGERSGKEFRVNSTDNLGATGTEVNPAVAMADSGNFVVVWEQSSVRTNDILLDTYIAGRMFDFYGNALPTGQPGGQQGALVFNANDFRVDAGAAAAPGDFTRTARNPQIAMDGAGNFVVAWEAFRDVDMTGGGGGNNAPVPNSYGAYFRRFNSNGTPLAADQAANQIFLGAGVNPDFGYAQVNPSVAIDGAGYVSVAWNGNGAEPNDLNPGNAALDTNHDTSGVFVRDYMPDGTVLSNESRVNYTAAGTQQYGAIGMSKQGDKIVVWSGAGVGDSSGIFFRHYRQTVDKLGPIPTELVTSGGVRLFPGDQVPGNAASLVVVFDENLSTAGGATGANSVLNPANWQVIDTSTGKDLQADQGIISGITFGLDPATNKYEATITFTGAGLGAGSYQIVPGVNLQDPAGNQLQSTAANPSQPANILGTNPPADEARRTRFNFTVAGAVSPAPAAAPAYGTEFRVNQNGQYNQQFFTPVVDGSGKELPYQYLPDKTVLEQSGRTLAMDHDGNFVVVWTSIGQAGSTNPADPNYDPHAATDGDIYMRLFDRDNQPLTGEILVNAQTVRGNQHNPSVAMSPTGDFVVAWQSDTDVAGKSGIYVRRFNSMGQPVISDINLDGQTLIAAYYPQLYAARPDLRTDTDAEFLVDPEMVGTQFKPAVAMDDAGDFVVIWGTTGQPYGYFNNLDGRRFNWRGEVQGTVFQLNSLDIPGPSAGVGVADYIDLNPAVAMDSNGNFLAAWERITQRSLPNNLLTSKIYVRRYSANGQAASAEFAVAAGTATFDGWASHNPQVAEAGTLSERNPAIAVDSLGNWLVAWEGYQDNDDSSAAGPDSYGIYSHALKNDGITPVVPQDLGVNYVFTTAGGQYPSNLFGGDQLNPSVAMTADGSPVYVWNGNGSDVTAQGNIGQRDSNGVWIQHRTQVMFGDNPSLANGGPAANGSSLDVQMLVNRTVQGIQQFPSVAVTPAGEQVVVWQGNGTGDSSGIFARRYASSGDTIGPEVLDVRLPDGTKLDPNNSSYDQNGNVVQPRFLIADVDENLLTGDPSTMADSVTNPDNWSLSRNGGDRMRHAIAHIDFGLDEAYQLGQLYLADPVNNVQYAEFKDSPRTNRWEAVLTLDGSNQGSADHGKPLSAGNYTLTALHPIPNDPSNPLVVTGQSGIRDATGNVLGRSGYYPTGRDFALSFRVGRATGTDDVVTPNGELYPENRRSVAMDGDGDQIVVWTSYDPTVRFDGHGRDRVYFRTIAKDGTRKVGPIEVTLGQADLLNDAQRHATVACDPDGDFVVAWTNYHNGNADIYARRFNADGTAAADSDGTVEAAFRVNTYTLDQQNFPVVAMDFLGEFIITWSSYGQEDGGQNGDGWGVYARRYDTFGHAESPEFHVNTTASGDQRFSSVAVDSHGGFTIAWASNQGTDPGTVGDENIMARSFYSDGSPLEGPMGSEFMVNLTTDGNQSYPDVAMTLQGDKIMFVWQSEAQDGDGWGVFSQTMDRQFQPLAGVPTGSTAQFTNQSAQWIPDGSIWWVFLNSVRGIYAPDPTGGPLPSDPAYTTTFPLDNGGLYYPTGAPGQGTPNPGDGYLVSALRVPPTDSVIDDVSLQLTIDHPDPRDLNAWLVHWDPQNGTQVAELFSGIGQPWAGSFAAMNEPAFDGTTFTDNAPLRIDDPSVNQSPWQFPGQYVPIDSFQRFRKMLAQGDWYLVVQDTLQSSDALDPLRYPNTMNGYGRLDSWSLTLNYDVRGRDVQLNQTTTQDQMYPSVATDYAGYFVVAWAGYGNQPGQEDQSQSGVYARRYQIGHPVVPQMDETRINMQVQGSQTVPSVACDSTGNFVVVWNSTPTVGGTTQVDEYISQNDFGVADKAGPIATDVNTSTGEDVLPGSTVSAGITNLTVTFDEALSTRDYYDPVTRTMTNSPGPDSVLNLGNWVMLRNGAAIPNAVSGVNYIDPSSSQWRGKYQAMVSLDPTALGAMNGLLPSGEYALEIRDNINDDYSYKIDPKKDFNTYFLGNAMDGDLDGVPGTRVDLIGSTGFRGYKLPFYVAGPDFAEFRINQRVGDDNELTQPGGTGWANEYSVRTLAVDDQGDFAAVWTRYDAAGNGNVYLRTFDRNNAPLTDEILVNAPATADMQAHGYMNDHPSIAMNAVGDLVVAWESNVDPFTPFGTNNTWDIYARRFDIMGRAQVSDTNHNGSIEAGDNSLPFRVNTDIANDQRDPAVAMDRFGDFVVVWDSNGQTLSYFNDVQAQRFDYLGRIQGGQFTVTAPTLPGGFSTDAHPSVSMDAVGNFAVAWEQSNIQWNGYRNDTIVMASVYLADGTLSVPAFQADNAADFISDPEHTNHFAAGPQTAQNAMNNPRERTARNPQVAMDASGNFIVAWEAFQDADFALWTTPSSYGVYFRQFRPDGTPVKSEDQQANLTITDNRPNISYPTPWNNIDKFALDQVNASVAVDADGDFAVAWNGNGAEPDPNDARNEATVTNHDINGVFFRRFTSSGTTGTFDYAGAQARANKTSSGEQRFPTIAMTPAGETVVLWSGVGVGDQHGVFARRYKSTTDTAGPLAVQLLAPDANRTMINAGDNLFYSPNSLLVVFDEQLNTITDPSNLDYKYSVRNPNNWILVGADGRQIQGAISSVDFSLDSWTNKWEATLHFAAPGLENGTYTLMASNNIHDVAGNPLGRTGLLPNGYVVTIPPTGSLSGYGFTFRIHQLTPQNPTAWDVDQQANPTTAPAAQATDIQTALTGGDISGRTFLPQVAVARNPWGDRISRTPADATHVVVWSSYRTGQVPASDLSANPTGAFWLPGLQSDIWAQMYNGNAEEVDTSLVNPLPASQRIGTAFQINTNTNQATGDQPGDQVAPDVAMAASGDFVVVWASDPQGPGDTSSVYGQRYYANGQPMGGPFRINDGFMNTPQARANTSAYQRQPKVAMDYNGDFVVTWHSADTSAGPDDDGIYARRYNAAGVPQGAEFLVNSTIPGRQESPDVAMDTNGDFTITWQSYSVNGNTGDGSSWGVYAQRYDSRGNRLGGEFQVNQYTANYQDHPSIAMDYTGDTVITWSSFAQDGNGYGVFARRYSSSGVALGNEFQVNQHTLDWQYQPSVAMESATPGMLNANKDGLFVITWSTFNQETPADFNYGIFARMYNPDGSDYVDTHTGNVLGEFRINAQTTGDQWYSDVSMDSLGDYVVAWVSTTYQTITTGTGNTATTRQIPQSDIYTRFLDPPGTVSDTPTVNNTMAVVGTSGDDVFEFTGGPTGPSWVLKLNGVVQTIPAHTSAITFDGLGGNDTVRVVGSAGINTIELSPYSGTVSSDAYTLTFTNVKRFEVTGGGGDDSATLHDSPGDDTLTGSPTQTTLSGSDFSQAVTNVPNVRVIASTGHDTANFTDSAGSDTFTGTPGYSTMSWTLPSGQTSTVRAEAFPSVTASSTIGGDDKAYLHGSSGGDTLYVSPPAGQARRHQFQSPHQVLLVGLCL